MPVKCPFRLLAYKQKDNPIISWDFNNIGYTQTDFRFQIASDSGYSNIIYDTGKIAGAETSYTIPTTLAYSNSYYTRGKVWADGIIQTQFGIGCIKDAVTPADSAYIDIGDNTDFDFNDEFTVLGWFRIKDTGAYYQTIFSKFDWSLNKGYMLSIYDGNIYLQIDNIQKIAAVGLLTDVWYQFGLILTHGGTGQAFVYLNNSPLSFGGGSTNQKPSVSVKPLYFGASPDADVYTNIDFDEFWFYNIAVSVAERTNHYNAGIGTTTPLSTTNMIAQYHFEEMAGIILNDSFGSNAGTLINTPFLMTDGIVITDTLINYESNWSGVVAPINITGGDYNIIDLVYGIPTNSTNISFTVTSVFYEIAQIQIYSYHKTNGWEIISTIAGHNYLLVDVDVNIDLTDYAFGFLIIVWNVGMSTSLQAYGAEYIGFVTEEEILLVDTNLCIPFYINAPENIRTAFYQEYDLTPYIDNSITKESEITKGSQLLNFNIDQTRYDWFSVLTPKTFIEFWKGQSPVNPCFSGWVQNRTPSLDGAIKNIAVRCVDPSDDMQGIIVNWAYINQSAYDIINHIINIYDNGNVLINYGFVLGNVGTGKVITHAFKHETFFDVMKYLGELNNFVWQIRVEGRFPNITKYIDFIPINYTYSNYVYTTALPDFNIKKGSLNYDDGIMTFANIIYLIGGKTESDVITETFNLIGANETIFNLSYPPLFGNIGAFVKIDGGAELDLGIDGIDDFITKDAVYNTDQKFVSINPALISGGETITIAYTWLYPLTCRMEDNESIKIYNKKEIVITRTDIIDLYTAKQFCKLYLKKNAIPAVRIGFAVEMDIETANIGEQSKIEISEYTINNYFPLVRKSETFTLPWHLDTSLQFQNIDLSLELKIKEIEDRIKRLEREKDIDTALDGWIFQKENIIVSDLSIQELLGGDDVYGKFGDKFGFKLFY